MAKKPYVFKYLYKVKVRVEHRLGGKSTDRFTVVSSHTVGTGAKEEIQRKITRWYKGTSYTPLKIEVSSVPYYEQYVLV